MATPMIGPLEKEEAQDTRSLHSGYETMTLAVSRAKCQGGHEGACDRSRHMVDSTLSISGRGKSFSFQRVFSFALFSGGHDHDP
jgi:hypothetical protein